MIVLIFIFIPTFFLVYSTELVETAIKISCNDLSDLDSGSAIHKEVKVASGKLMKVILCSNSTTGFHWELRKISEPSVLKKICSRYEAPDDKKGVGIPGKEIWTFRALEKGKSLLHMEYRRLLEEDKTAEWSVILAVDVE
jgi:predicted secreted protein